MRESVVREGTLGLQRVIPGVRKLRSGSSCFEERSFVRTPLAMKRSAPDRTHLAIQQLHDDDSHLFLVVVHEIVFVVRHARFACF